VAWLQALPTPTDAPWATSQDIVASCALCMVPKGFFR